MLIQEFPMLLTVILLSIRVAVTFAFTPLFALFPVPPVARTLLLLMLAALIATAINPAVPVPVSMGSWFEAAALEFSFGLLLACGIFCAFAAFAFAGRTLDVQIGFGMAQVFDPVSRSQVPVLTAAFVYLAVIVFFLTDGHHALLRGLAYSAQVVPVGSFSFDSVNLSALIASWGKLYGLGFMWIAPVAALLLLIEIGLGLLARGLPQMNVFILALPVKIMVGLIALVAWTRIMPSGMERIYGLTSEVWNGVAR